MSKIGIILLINAINGLVAGLSYRFGIGWLTIATVIFGLILVAGFSEALQVEQAKHRPTTRPITSLDQVGSGLASLIILGVEFILFAYIGGWL